MMNLKDITVALEQAVAAGDLGAIGNVVTELKALVANVAPPQRLDHSSWPPEIGTSIYDITKADLQNIDDVLERAYANASDEERSRVRMEMIRKARRPASPDREGVKDTIRLNAWEGMTAVWDGEQILLEETPCEDSPDGITPFAEKELLRRFGSYGVYRLVFEGSAGIADGKWKVSGRELPKELLSWFKSYERWDG